MENSQFDYGFGIKMKGYEKNRAIIIWATVILSVIVFALLIFAANAWTDNCSKLNTTNWANGMQTYIVSGKVVEAQQSYGINGFCIQSVSSATGGISTATPVWQKWSDCSIDFCNSCKESVNTVIALLIIAIVFITLVIPLSFIRLQYCNCKDSRNMRYFILFTTLLVIIFSLSAYGYWSSQCYKAIDRSPEGYDLTYGAGYGLTIVSWFLSFVILVLHLLKPKGSAMHSMVSDRARQISSRHLTKQASDKDFIVDSTKNIIADTSSARSL